MNPLENFWDEIGGLVPQLFFNCSFSRELNRRKQSINWRKIKKRTRNLMAKNEKWWKTDDFHHFYRDEQIELCNRGTKYFISAFINGSQEKKRNLAEITWWNVVDRLVMGWDIHFFSVHHYSSDFRTLF